MSIRILQVCFKYSMYDIYWWRRQLCSKMQHG